jgi:hypothetical protein
MTFDKAKFDKQLKIMIMILSTALIVYVVARMSGCGSLEPPKPADPPQVSCGELKVGETKATLCPDGKSKKVEACTDKGLQVSLDCPVNACGKVTFQEIKPIIQGKCVSCHQGFDSFDKAKSLSGQMVQRVNLDSNSPQRMPKSPNPPLPDNEKSLFSKWQADGLLESCEAVGKEERFDKFYNFDEIESAIETDLSKLNKDQKQNSRYLLLTHKIDESLPKTDLIKAIEASSKAINSLAAKASRLSKPIPSGLDQSILRIDLRDFELSQADWRLITQVDEMQLESFTNRGLLIKFLTQEFRPWMHFDNFIDTTFRNSELYYKLTGVPNTFDELTKKLGVNYAQDLADFRADLIGTNKSPISLQKNRLISRHDSTDGFFWVTYDILPIQGKRERNLSEFPLLKETGGQAIFQFDASEVIFNLKNGLMGFALFNGKGQRQNAAPLQVVADNISPINPEIRAGNSCSRCHNAGLIPAVDEIRDHVTQNSSSFRKEDVDIVLQVYKVKDFNDQRFKDDDSNFTDHLKRIDVSSDIDPMNLMTDRLLLNWDVKKTAAFLFLSVEDFVRGLNGSLQGRAQIGQLLSGGSISRDQFVTILPVLKRDLRLFQEPLGK